jgi:hypothetical protein
MVIAYRDEGVVSLCVFRAAASAALFANYVFIFFLHVGAMDYSKIQIRSIDAFRMEF